MVIKDKEKEKILITIRLEKRIINKLRKIKNYNKLINDLLKDKLNIKD